ncbi:MAG: hypothetical protein Q4C70_11340, partial [Planctomycetia bacterium]|nr:hypothetical protein [Planctomycetia bacterium]
MSAFFMLILLLMLLGMFVAGKEIFSQKMDECTERICREIRSWKTETLKNKVQNGNAQKFETVPENAFVQEN